MISKVHVGGNQIIEESKELVNSEIDTSLTNSNHANHPGLERKHSKESMSDAKVNAMAFENSTMLRQHQKQFA